MRPMRADAYLLGFDVGSSSIKAALLDARTGAAVASAVSPKTELAIAAPHPGWAEQDAEGWWTATVKACRALLDRAGAKPADVAAISFSGQMHGLVCLDEHYQPLRPAILWCDQRTTAECRAITRAIGLPRLLRTVGNPALQGFTLPKILWVRKDSLSPGMIRF